jgi:hypothetical protein
MAFRRSGCELIEMLLLLYRETKRILQNFLLSQANMGTGNVNVDFRPSKGDFKGCVKNGDELSF